MYCFNMISSTASATVESSNVILHKRDSDDMGWNFGKIYDPSNKDKVECLLCGHRMSGGVRRIKEYIAHIRDNVKACPKSTKEEQESCKNNINSVKVKKMAKFEYGQDVKDSVPIGSEEKDEGQEDLTIRRKKVGPMDRHSTPIDPIIPLTLKQFR
ncbi:hypothetical protein ABZP36_012416 [Zizania latifolia]